MSIIELLSGGTLGALLLAIWRGVKQVAREEVEREYEEDHRTLDLSSVTDLRKSIRLEIEAEFEPKFKDQELLYDNLKKDFLAHVIDSNRKLERLSDLERDFGLKNAELSAAQHGKELLQKDLVLEKTAREAAERAAIASDTQARESLELAGRLQEALTRAEMTINTLNAQTGYLQGVATGLTLGYQNLPIALHKKPDDILAEINAKTEVSNDNTSI